MSRRVGAVLCLAFVMSVHARDIKTTEQVSATTNQGFSRVKLQKMDTASSVANNEGARLNAPRFVEDPNGGSPLYLYDYQNAQVRGCMLKCFREPTICSSKPYSDSLDGLLRMAPL